MHQPKSPDERDPRKAARFFEYARVVSEAGNYDYAIVCWINGLKHDPLSMTAHRELLDAAYRRQALGGKPVGYRQLKNVPSSTTSTDLMLREEFLWAHDPLNKTRIASFIEAAVRAEMYEVAQWASDVLRQNPPDPD